MPNQQEQAPRSYRDLLNSPERLPPEQSKAIHVASTIDKIEQVGTSELPPTPNYRRHFVLCRVCCLLSTEVTPPEHEGRQ
jgi:hypothetical protein